MKYVSILLIILLLLTSCVSRNKYDNLYTQLTQFIEGQDAKIGVAVIIDGKDTVGVNENLPFPMLSVYKFPIALALGDYCRKNNCLLTDSCLVVQSDLHKDTYSPMLSQYAEMDSVRITLYELLEYSLQQSDNNASDILLKKISGSQYVQKYLDKLEFKDIIVKSTEDEMHKNTNLCYDNTSTPLAMARLLYQFDVEFNDTISCQIKHIMETCTTGADRLILPLSTIDATVAHKTGTGFMLPNGRLMAINDVGYVHLSDKKYSIAVFVSDSNYDIDRTASIIVEISRIIVCALSGE